MPEFDAGREGYRLPAGVIPQRALRWMALGYAMGRAHEREAQRHLVEEIVDDCFDAGTGRWRAWVTKTAEDMYRERLAEMDAAMERRLRVIGHQCALSGQDVPRYGSYPGGPVDWETGQPTTPEGDPE